ncbi:MAG: GTP-binding protein, partial [Clostridia bacterium]|nr:GTP-binding protein [Clostridia bacterium]
MVKVDVISGFLGAGKTTLIKRLLSSAFKGEKVVLIENEFGEIGVDGSFLKEAGIEIKEINSGCICCSLVGDFEKSMEEIISKFEPERVIIEPSGVGKLSDIVKAIEKVKADLQLNIIATVADDGKVGMYMKNFGEFYIDQIKQANTIVISKTDKISEAKLQKAVENVRSINATATLITTNLESLDHDTLLSALQSDVHKVDSLLEELKQAHHEDHHHHDGECHCHGHHHHDEECHCHEHNHEHHHHHDEEGHCCHHHEHGEECHCHDHDHDHNHEHNHEGEECCCHDHEHHEGERHHGHHHEHGEECHCHDHEHEHHHDGECHCHDHDHEHHHDGECHCHDHDHEHHHEPGHHHADEVFTSWGEETVVSYTKS